MINLSRISPFFIVESLKDSLSFYTGRLGFDIRHVSPGNDPFFAIVGRDHITVMLKQIAPGVKPVPNHFLHQWARWDACITTADPDGLFEEYRAGGVSFLQPIKDDDDGLRGFELADADGHVLFFGRPVS